MSSDEGGVCGRRVNQSTVCMIVGDGSGVLMYGPPGTGKTMMAKAVAHHTNASFIAVVGSEFVQKYLGEGPRSAHLPFRLSRVHLLPVLLPGLYSPTAKTPSYQPDS